MSGRNGDNTSTTPAATFEVRQDSKLDLSGAVRTSAAVVDQFTRIQAEEQRRIDDVRKIYPARDAVSPFNAAMELLQTAVACVNEARDHLRQNEVIEADDQIQHLQFMLPELFCFREIGDGFAAIINALLQAFRSLEGKPLEHDQVEAVGRALRGLQVEPFQTHEDAIPDIMALEDVRLVVDPPELHQLVD